MCVCVRLRSIDTSLSHAIIWIDINLGCEQVFQLAEQRYASDTSGVKRHGSLIANMIEHIEDKTAMVPQWIGNTSANINFTNCILRRNDIDVDVTP